MAKEIIGKSAGKGKKIGIVVSRFNEYITLRLLKACVDELVKNGVKQNDITICWVPGAYEIPLAAKNLAGKKAINAVICLGAIIRGETYHYELVAQGAAVGIMQAMMASGKPVIFEVLAADTIGQINQRSAVKGRNKGHDAALAALEMVSVISQLGKK
jgi:6,7-dimethyl-8-ribityllumazine synthase